MERASSLDLPAPGSKDRAVDLVAGIVRS